MGITINTIIEELRDVPINRLEELYSFIHSLKGSAQTSEGLVKRNEILSFAGSISNFSQIDYDQFVEKAKQARTKLFDRDFEL